MLPNPPTGVRSRRIGETPTPTLLYKQVPGKAFGEAEPEAVLPRHRAFEVLKVSNQPRS
jgi:hypothetical protein